MEEITETRVDTARELELKVECDDMAEVLQAPDKTRMNEELLLKERQREWFLEVCPAPGKDFIGGSNHRYAGKVYT